MSDLIERLQVLAKHREMGGISHDEYSAAIQDLRDEFLENQNQLSFPFFDENGEDNEHYWDRLEKD